MNDQTFMICCRAIYPNCEFSFPCHDMISIPLSRPGEVETITYSDGVVVHAIFRFEYGKINPHPTELNQEQLIRILQNRRYLGYKATLP